MYASGVHKKEALVLADANFYRLSYELNRTNRVQIDLIADLSQIIEVGYEEWLGEDEILDAQMLDEEQEYGFVCWLALNAFSFATKEEIVVQFFRIENGQAILLS